jgi:hypothetical protein
LAWGSANRKAWGPGPRCSRQRAASCARFAPRRGHRGEWWTFWPLTQTRRIGKACCEHDSPPPTQPACERTRPNRLDQHPGHAGGPGGEAPWRGGAGVGPPLYTAKPPPRRSEAWRGGDPGEWWRCRESNPGPSATRQGFYGRSPDAIFSAPAIPGTGLRQAQPREFPPLAQGEVGPSHLRVGICFFAACG